MALVQVANKTLHAKGVDSMPAQCAASLGPPYAGYASVSLSVHNFQSHPAKGKKKKKLGQGWYHHFIVTATMKDMTQQNPTSAFFAMAGCVLRQ
jgi:hypothetical protein